MGEFNLLASLFASEFPWVKSLEIKMEESAARRSKWMGKRIPGVLHDLQTRGSLEKWIEPGLLVRRYLNQQSSRQSVDIPPTKSGNESPEQSLVRILWTKLPFGSELIKAANEAFACIEAVPLITVLLKYSYSACGRSTRNMLEPTVSPVTQLKWILKIASPKQFGLLLSHKTRTASLLVQRDVLRAVINFAQDHNFPKFENPKIDFLKVCNTSSDCIR